MSSKDSPSDPFSPGSDSHSVNKAVYKPPSLRSSNMSARSTAPSMLFSSEGNNTDFENLMNVSEDSEEKGEVNTSSEPFDLKSFKGRPSSCVFVASLSAAMSDDHLCSSVTKHFERWGELVMVKVLRDTSNRPYAFVQYTNDQDASTALREAHQSLLDGRAIRCEAAKVNRTLYISTSKNELLSESEVTSYLKRFGEIEQLIGTGAFTPKHVSSSGEPCYSAWFCKFAYRDDAVRAYANLRSRQNWIAEWAQNIDHTTRSAEATIDRKAIFVGQLNPKVTKDILIDRFSRHGHIESANLVSKSGNTFAFFKYDTEEAAAAAVERENHAVLMEKTMHVQYREVNHTSSRSRGAPVLRLAPPPVNLQPKRYLHHKNYSYSDSVPPKSPLGNFHVPSRNSSKSVQRDEGINSIRIKNNDVFDLMLSSLMAEKLKISNFDSPAKSMRGQSTRASDYYSKSGTATPTTSPTTISSYGVRKSMYSTTGSGGVLNYFDKGEQLAPAPYYYYYPTVNQSSIFYDDAINGSNTAQPPNCYYPPDYSYYYENSIGQDRRELQQSDPDKMAGNNQTSLKSRVNQQYVSTLDSQKENRAPEV